MKKPRASLALLLVGLWQSLVVAGESAAWKEQGSRGNTPLHAAALSGDLPQVVRLLASGMSARSTNHAGATPLHYGAGDPGIVKALLEAGADPNARTASGMTPLHSATARPESFAVVRQLLKAGAEADSVRPPASPGDAGMTPLTYATLAGDERSVRLLLDRGASPGGTNGFTPVAAAAFAGRERILKRLLDRGGSVDCDDGFAGTPLNNAFYTGHLNLVPLLMGRGASLHLTSSFGEKVPPIVWSAYNEAGNAAMTRLLMERGVDINEASSAGDTALRWALKRGETPLTTFLKAHGATEGSRPLKRKEVPRNAIPADSAARERMIHDGIQRAVDLLQRGSDGFLANGFVKRAECVSCHQQTLPAVAFGRARELGFRLDEASLARQLRVQHASWSKTRDQAYEMYEPQPASPANLGYGLRGLHALRYEPDELTEAMVWYLAASQRPHGSWRDNDWRPPMESGVIAGTAMAVKALQLFPQPLPGVNLNEHVVRARHWLERCQPADLAQRAYRLQGLTWAGATRNSLRREARALLELQRPDGGWSPVPGIESDAWATGHLLVALREAGVVEKDDPAVRRGMDFLLRTQFADGSWWVPSRTWPFQPHFDSGFPHGKDQWISAAGTAWATLALLDALPAGPGRLSQEIPSAQELMARADRATSPKNSKPGVASTPAVRGRQWEFIADIQPLLQRSCVGCHGGEKPKGDFRLDALEHLFKAGQSGEPAIIRGRTGDSPLLRLVSDQVEDLEMPPKSRRSKFPALSPEEIQRLREWVDQGAQ